MTSLQTKQAQLDEAYRVCRGIAAEHGKSYFLATRLLTPDRRPAIHALYAAARVADDIVDVGADLPGRDPEGELLAWSRAALEEVEAGWSDDPVRLALVHTVRRYDIPLEHFVDFLAAMTSDLDVTGYVGPYLFPPMTRRRIPATMYMVLAACCMIG